MTEKLCVVGPSTRASVAHLKDVGDHVEYSEGGIGPDVMEEAQGADVQNSFNR